ncbi:hypothetical protein [Streptomyces minutiscleroticus]|uniref:hypothetical protein n=1 Tax=Streptomyces minutiscleroticus TaxID=68238 RepID=UPI0027E3C4B4|nr:hypothetical protein [Streptomyces minutiscleroticus]
MGGQQYQDAADERGRDALGGSQLARGPPGTSTQLREELAHGAQRELRPAQPADGDKQQQKHAACVLPVQQVHQVLVAACPDDGGGPGQQQRQSDHRAGQHQQTAHRFQ